MIFIGNGIFPFLTDHMMELLVIERSLIQSLRDYITAQKQCIDRFNSVVEACENASGDFPEDLEKHISNPFTAYKLVRRLRLEWNMVDQVTKTCSSYIADFLANVSLVSQRLPSEKDMDGVALGLLRLQDIYRQLQIITVDVSGQVNVTPLDPDESFHVAMVALQNHKFQYALLWLQETFRQLEDGIPALVTRREVLTYLGPLAFQMGNLPLALELTQQLQELDPSCRQTMVHLAYYRTLRESIRCGSQTQTPSLPSDAPVNILTLIKPASETYESLCRGEGIKMTPRRQRTLRCRYSTGRGNPRLIYAPIKEEQEWDHPLIIRYHDLVSEKEIETIKHLSRSKLDRAKVSDHVTGERFSAETRVAKSAWLADEDNPVISRVTQRMADLTGLDMEAAEMLQVANYGIGGQYEPHFDNKMSDVAVGGSTVFPDIGAALRPYKGSAVLWYNLLQNGEEDARTLHAACPVFVGNKLVANKWVRAHGQEFRRRCSLSQMD
ncbi:prolyl 4-hydroxylase subunit alpha-2-like [Salvelinus namaycush]|uniref:procollagen-proline 4-dioxygenase n=1 Tax=Salvelinus namaycush TaxID=8040 RepID=A0A8U0QKS8_SALNM|nr:prolyl 4-hydroxylase subunit alpha-2-like [Salvelinus namaycush]